MAFLSSTAIGLCVAWLFWRVWTFTIQPRLSKGTPIRVPYLVPWLGHMVGFFRDGDGVIAQNRRRYAPNREPFNLVLGGQNVYIITSAKDASTVFRNVTDLTFDAYVRDLMLKFGASPQAYTAMWAKPSLESSMRCTEKDFPNPNKKPLLQLCEDIMKAQLHPGPAMELLHSNFVQRVSARITWNSIPATAIRHKNETDTERVISLKNWLEYLFLNVATEIFFGDAITKVEPNLLENFAAFDNDAWKFTYQMPAFVAKKVYEAKARLQNAFKKYAELPVEERSDASWLVKTLEAEMRAAGMGNEDIGAYFLMLFWPIHGNPWKVTFWLVSHMLSQPDLKGQIQGEINQLFKTYPEITTSPWSKKLDQCSVLTATYHEALRWASSTVTVRDVIRDCIIGNKLLTRGSRLLVAYRELLLDEAVFGAEPTSFQPERFLLNPALAKNASFRPFGGGLTYCPGRFISQKQVFSVVALLIGKFHLELYEPDAAFPKPANKPALGTMAPDTGEDVLMVVRRK